MNLWLMHKHSAPPSSIRWKPFPAHCGPWFCGACIVNTTTSTGFTELSLACWSVRKMVMHRIHVSPIRPEGSQWAQWFWDVSKDRVTLNIWKVSKFYLARKTKKTYSWKFWKVGIIFVLNKFTIITTSKTRLLLIQMELVIMLIELRWHDYQEIMDLKVPGFRPQWPCPPYFSEYNPPGLLSSQYVILISKQLTS